MDKKRIIELKEIATNVRKNALTAVHAAGSGHPGGSLSIADVLTLLYFEVMHVDPKNPNHPDRDRLVLSKGHCAPALYGVLAERGYFSRADMKTLRKAGSYLQGHPDMKSVPGVDMSSGSLGQGVCAANGMALAGKIDKKDYRVYTILGDGELEEGQVWEAAMYAPHYKLDNVTAFVDFNGLQIDGNVTDVMSPLPIDEKFRAFGWHAIVCDGHDFEAMLAAINEAKETKGKPTVIILKTIKGKGVSFMENNAAWHGSAPNDEQYAQGMEELNAELARVRGEL